DSDGEFDLSGSAYYKKIAETGFVSGRSTHADRIATIRWVYSQYGVEVDPHTADGMKVGIDQGQKAPLICLETALPAKFSATLREALGREPRRPAELKDLEKRPQRFQVVPPEADFVKRIIEKEA